LFIADYYALFDIIAFYRPDLSNSRYIGASKSSMPGARCIIDNSNYIGFSVN